jgi:hypothetical protein
VNTPNISEDPMRTTRPARAAVIAAGLLAAVTACGGGSTPAAPTAAPPTADAASATATVCGSLLRLDGVPAPEGGPDGPPPAAAVKEWGAATAPALDAALAQAPTALAPSLTVLQPVFRAAAQGAEPDYEDPAFTGAITAYETWAHENCGYQRVSLTGTDFRFAGAPATLEPGPVSVLLTNESAGGQFHVAHLARAKDPATTIDQVVNAPMEQLMELVEIVPGFAQAAPGQTGGFLADLEPGKYFLICPVGEEGQLPHHVQGMITEMAVA